jgi:hypothetical protein
MCKFIAAPVLLVLLNGTSGHAEKQAYEIKNLGAFTSDALYSTEVNRPCFELEMRFNLRLMYAAICSLIVMPMCRNDKYARSGVIKEIVSGHRAELETALKARTAAKRHTARKSHRKAA